MRKRRHDSLLTGEVLSYHDNIRALLTGRQGIRVIINTILSELKDITRCTRSSLVLGDEIISKVLKLDSMRQVKILKGGRCDGLTGWAIQNGINILTNNAGADPRYDPQIDREGRLKIDTMICTPVKFRDRIVGCLRAVNKRGQEFTEWDLDIITSGADYIALALERAFLYEKLKNDELTNLFNIRYLHQALEMEIERAKRYGSTFSVIFMDMDDFKEINDRHGHLIGSRVLIEIADILQNNLRRIDIISRYGGDEFVIILPQTTREAGFIVAERLRRLIEGHVFLKREGFNIQITASLGVASYPDNAKNREELLKLADRAMYRGKFLRKNTVFAAR